MTQAQQAVFFLTELSYQASLKSFALASRRETARFGDSRDAQGWIERRADHEIGLMLTQSQPTRIIAIQVPMQTRTGRLLPEPAIVVEAPRLKALAWVLRHAIPADKALELTEKIASGKTPVVLPFGGKPLDLLPLPGPGGVRRIQHLKGEKALCNPGAFEEQEDFIEGTAVQMRPIDYLWPGVMPYGQLALLPGYSGMGKTQMALLFAAIVTKGGIWPDGAPCERGSAAIFEKEDPLDAATKPRLVAAGADMRKIAFGKPADFAQGVDILERIREKKPDLRLVVLSPLVTFFGDSQNYDEKVWRKRLDPILQWAAAHRIAVVGIVHLDPNNNQRIAGSATLLKVARCRLDTAGEADEPLKLLKTRKVQYGRSGIELPYEIESVQLPGGIETSRIVFVKLEQKPKLTKDEKTAIIYEEVGKGQKDLKDLRKRITGRGVDWRDAVRQLPG
jgi:AAA domain